MRYILALLNICVLCFATSAGADPAKDVFKKIEPYSVGIIVEDGTGSGTIVGANGDSVDVLTCFHVIDGDKHILIVYDDEGVKIQTTKATVIATDKPHDLALLRTTNPKHRPVAPVAEIEPEDYEELYTVASPLGIQRQAATERLATKDMKTGWTFTGMAIFGMSGSAAMNERGEVTCVIRGTATDDDEIYTQMGYCIPLSAIRSFLKGAAK